MKAKTGNMVKIVFIEYLHSLPRFDESPQRQYKLFFCAVYRTNWEGLPNFLSTVDSISILTVSVLHGGTAL